MSDLSRQQRSRSLRSANSSASQHARTEKGPVARENDLDDRRDYHQATSDSDAELSAQYIRRVGRGDERYKCAQGGGGDDETNDIGTQSTYDQGNCKNSQESQCYVSIAILIHGGQLTLRQHQ